MHPDIIKVFYSPTDVRENCLRINIKIYIKQLRHVSVQTHHHQGAHYLCLLKLQIVTLASMNNALTCFCANSPSSGSALFVLAKVTNCNFSKHECAPWWWCVCTETCRSCFNVNFNIVFKTNLLCISWWIKYCGNRHCLHSHAIVLQKENYSTGECPCATRHTSDISSTDKFAAV